MVVRRQGICLWAAPLVLFCALAHAQSTVTPEDEYKQLIKIDQDVQPLGPHPFGEHISLYDGTLSFEQTDVSLPGDGPTIQLSRSLQKTDPPRYNFNAQLPFGDWDLEIPRIETYVGSGEAAAGAIWQNVNSPTERCTYFSAPPVYGPSQPGADPWTPDQWWYGYHLILPGQGSQELMPRALQNTLSPTISGVSFSIVTKQNWMIGCGVTASDGGEGFLAIAPDGTRYTFAQLVYRPMQDITSPLGTPPGAAVAEGVHPLVAPENILYRRDALMYVTQIQDRFGNTLTYHYDPTSGYLTGITANDGRQLTLTYVSGTSLIHTVTAQASNAPVRTWTYNYDTTTNPLLPTLTGVQLPDGTAWAYHLGLNFQLVTTGGDCQTNTLPILQSSSFSGSITAPSGLKASFTLTPMLRGRSYVPKQCWGGLTTGGLALYAAFPNAYYQYSLTSETLTGPGLLTQTWGYSYSPANESWTTDACASNNSCPSTVYTDVTDPEGHDVRSTFSNRFDASEGELLQTDYYTTDSNSPILRSVKNGYANPTGGPWPVAYGIDLQDRDNRVQTEEVAPLNQRILTQNGDTYTWQATAFNAYAQATDVKRSNNIAGQTPIEETTSYLNDSHLWVLGLPETVTNKGSGEVESANTYDPSNDTLQSRARFGQTLMSYTFNPAGELASFTDGDGNITGLTDYYRGIPRTITYPDATTETLQVDDLGEITQITDQAGHATGYGYDAGGRVDRIDYPAGDEAAWLPTTLTTGPVSSEERGLAAGHWKQTVTTGNAQTVTYFNAMLQPVLRDHFITGDASSNTTTLTTYDALGHTSFTSYPNASALNFTATPAAAGITGVATTYDALGRVYQTLQDSELGTLTTTTQYLPGAQVQVTDPKSNVTTSTYQVFDQPSYNAVIKVQAPEGVTQTIARDLYGNPTAITQSGLYNGTETDSITKTLFYDSAYRLCRTTEPESGSTVMSYDGANNLAWSAAGLSISGTGCGQEQVADAAKTQFAYDSLNRLKTMAPPAGTQSTLYTYTPTGEVAWANSGPAIWENHYNFRGMLTSETLHLVGQDDRTLGYAHDSYGNLSQLTYPDGETVSYAPDALGRPTQVGGYASSISYFPNGQVQQFLYGNGTAYAASQNARQLVSNFSYGTASTLNLSEDMAYDGDANITSVTDLDTNQRSKSFQYDGLSRLTQAVAPNLWGTQSYQYDPLNNLRQQISAGQTATYHYDPTNRLASITGGASPATFLYDARGNEIGKNNLSLMFDAKDQLTQIPGLDRYQYDASGRRVQKTPANGGASSYPLYNHAGQLLYQYAPGQATGTNYIYLGTRMIARHQTLQLAAPGAVSFDSNPNNGSYTVSWGAVPAATSYTLQESANGGAWATVYSGSATSVAMSGKSGGSYVYQVQGCAQGACGGWTGSATLGVTPPVPTVSGPATLVFGTYTVSWSGASGATAYNVQESFNGGAWATIASGITASSLSVTRPNGGTYAYQVQASNSYGNRGWSASATVSVTQVPAPPTNLLASSSGGHIVLTWDAMPWATSYVITVYGTNGSLGEYTYNVVTNTFNMPGEAPGKYSFTISACSIAGCSAAVSNSNGLFTFEGTSDASSAKALAAKVLRAVGMDRSSAQPGCGAELCTVVAGGNP